MSTLILVVDDNEHIRHILHRALTKAGFDVLTASHGMEALQIARAMHPDLILLDIDLPDISGLDVCRELKADPETNSIDVLFITGGYMREADAYDAGAVKLIRKPFSLRALIESVKELLEMDCIMAMI